MPLRGCWAILISKNAIINMMSVITIKYDLKMDLQNYEDMHINRRFPDYGRGDFDTAPNLWPNVKDNIAKADTEEKIKIVEGYLLRNYSDNKAIRISENAINDYWATI